MIRLHEHGRMKRTLFYSVRDSLCFSEPQNGERTLKDLLCPCVALSVECVLQDVSSVLVTLLVLNLRQDYY